MFAGYQAEGTLGRQLQNGETNVSLFGEKVAVRAKIETMPDMSSHADAEGLLQWIGAFRKHPEKVFLVHGDDEAMSCLEERIKDNYSLDVACPYSGSVFNLVSGEFDYTAEPVFIRKEVSISTRNDEHRARLAEAIRSVSELAERQKQGTNKDMDKLSQELENLCEKYKF